MTDALLQNLIMSDLIQTPIITADGKEIVLFHFEKILPHEIEALSEFTARELKDFCKAQGFKEHKIQ